jgi:hypothetical protein
METSTLTRQEWAQKRHNDLFDEFSALIESGVKSRKAVDELKDKYQIQNYQSAYRIIAKVRNERENQPAS